MDPSQRQKPILIAAIGILVITVLLFAAVALFSGRSTKVAQNKADREPTYKPDALNPTETAINPSNFNQENTTSDVRPTTSNPVISPSATSYIPPAFNRTDENTYVYSDPEKKYSFRYLKKWKIANKSTVTILTDPAKLQSQQCDVLLPGMLYCDILISTIPYFDPNLIGPEVNFNVIPTAAPIPQQVKNSAEALFGSNAIQPTLINDYRGYQATTQVEGTYIYNILLQGKKSMLLMQFPGKWSQSTLNLGQRTVLDSIAEIVTN